MQTTATARQYDFIVFEYQQIRNMTKSAKDTVDKPGKNVVQKRRLNREMLWQGWGGFKFSWYSKVEWAGKLTKFAPSHNASRTCSGRGVVDGSHRKGKRYECHDCRLHIDAYRNAAINILHWA